MFKLVGGVIVGVFIGALMVEVVRRERPDLLEAIEDRAKLTTDRLFESLREAYDFRELTD